MFNGVSAFQALEPPVLGVPSGHLPHPSGHLHLPPTPLGTFPILLSIHPCPSGHLPHPSGHLSPPLGTFPTPLWAPAPAPSHPGSLGVLSLSPALRPCRMQTRSIPSWPVLPKHP